MNIKVQIKPLSVNKAWKGRRYKTEQYKEYEEELLMNLPDGVKIKSSLEIEFGFSNKNCDIDNPVKVLLDVMQKKYGFNDKLIKKLYLKKEIVKKGHEYIKIVI